MTDNSKLTDKRCPINTKRGNMDYIQKLLRRDVDDFRMQSFHNFGLEIFVLPASDAAGIYDVNGSWIGFDRYYFDLYSKGSKPMTVQISKDVCVQIWYRKQWRPVSSYLERLKPAIDWNASLGDSKYETQRARCEQQQRWWAANSKTFRLMDLPSEIREIIYGCAIGPKVEPYPTCRARRLGKGNAVIVARMPNTSLLFTSKLIYQEASNILFRYTPFFVDRLGVLSKLLQNAEQSSHIRRLELSLSNIEYFKLFGMKCKDEIFYEPRSAAHVLQQLQLDRLEINFAAPSATTSVDWLDNACQKTAVDWILDEGWPFIRGHPTKLTGYVKRSSRALFEARRVEETERIELWQSQRAAAGAVKGDTRGYYAELDEEEGGVSLDQAKAAKKSMKREQVKLYPLTCYCRRRCEFKRWTSKG